MPMTDDNAFRISDTTASIITTLTLEEKSPFRDANIIITLVPDADIQTPGQY
jgi:hypothetical protein